MDIPTRRDNPAMHGEAREPVGCSMKQSYYDVQAGILVLYAPIGTGFEEHTVISCRLAQISGSAVELLLLYVSFCIHKHGGDAYRIVISQ